MLLAILKIDGISAIFVEQEADETNEQFVDRVHEWADNLETPGEVEINFYLAERQELEWSSS